MTSLLKSAPVVGGDIEEELVDLAVDSDDESGGTVATDAEGDSGSESAGAEDDDGESDAGTEEEEGAGDAEIEGAEGGADGGGGEEDEEELLPPWPTNKRKTAKKRVQQRRISKMTLLYSVFHTDLHSTMTTMMKTMIAMNQTTPNISKNSNQMSVTVLFRRIIPRHFQTIMTRYKHFRVLSGIARELLWMTSTKQSRL